MDRLHIYLLTLLGDPFLNFFFNLVADFSEFRQFRLSLPSKAAGSSNDQCIRLLTPGQDSGQFCSAPVANGIK